MLCSVGTAAMHGIMRGYFCAFLRKCPFFVLTIHDMAEDDHKVSVADTVKRSDLQEGFAEDLYESCRSRSRNIK
jgi:hypothetical protein